MDKAVRALHVSEEASPIERIAISHPYGDTVREELVKDILLHKSKWITPQDLADKRAFIHLDGEAKIKLAHLGGAPFTDDPKHTLHDVQKDFLMRQEREQILHGGSRLGKSVLGGISGSAQITIPGQRVAIIADTYDHCYHEFDYARQMFDNLFGEEATTIYDFLHHGNVHKMQIDTIWDSTLQVFSVGNDYLDSILGTEWDMVIAGEGSKIAPEIIRLKVWRALTGRAKIDTRGFRRLTGFLLVFTTPDGEFGYPNYEIERINKVTRGHPEQFQLGAKRYNYETQAWEVTPWEESVYIRTASVLENPAYSREEVEAAAARLGRDSAAFQEQYMGRVVRRTGVILNRFNQDKHRVNMPSQEHLKTMRFAVGIDFGKNFGAVLIGLDRKNCFYVLGEVFNVEKLTSEDATAIKRMCISILGPLYGMEGVSPREVDIDLQWREVQKAIDLIYVDAAGQQKDDIQHYLGFPIGYTGGLDVVASLNLLNELFGDNKLFLENSLFTLPDEIKNLVWKPTKRGIGGEGSKEEPHGQRHVCDALRYGIIPLAQLGSLGTEEKSYDFFEAYARSQLDDVTRKAIYGEELKRETHMIDEWTQFFE